MNDKSRLTFSQREGYEEVPGPLRLEELPDTARTRIWNVLFMFMNKSSGSYESYRHVGGAWRDILHDVHVYHDSLPADEWSNEFGEVRQRLRHRIEQDPFHRVFDLIEFIMGHWECPRQFLLAMHAAISDCQLAYTIDLGPPPTLLPATTTEEGYQLTRNLSELREAGLGGATTHLSNASQHIYERDWAGSVRESIHAVESVARRIDPRASRSLGAALASLEEQDALHPAFKQAISKLYGYTSDEQGIRHALLDKAEANVTIDEAVFMLGACASFASYLWRKHKSSAAP